ncbi:photosystem I reaction center subunit N, chloroplastic [Andrographis paniculata]|uniref:photosystem I reaction center subunit N, chloroplastic n=1 Tax=Andrographis paniculata TaxID=175694 RepID=UPI0021E8A62B|nr:photosystem I reaction center subunit N, chloroplastic [Andrographis paniculata]
MAAHLLASSTYAISPIQINPNSLPSSSSSSSKLPSLPLLVKAQSQSQPQPQPQPSGRKAALIGLGVALFAATTVTATATANAGVIDDYLAKSQANKELNDKKRLATTNANFARAYTVQFGTCKFPENFTGCQDLAKQGKVPFLSEDLDIECKGKDIYKCGSNVFWKWNQQK